MNDELNKLKTKLLRAGLKKEASYISKLSKITFYKKAEEFSSAVKYKVNKYYAYQVFSFDSKYGMDKHFYKLFPGGIFGDKVGAFNLASNIAPNSYYSDAIIAALKVHDKPTDNINESWLIRGRRIESGSSPTFSVELNSLSANVCTVNLPKYEEGVGHIYYRLRSEQMRESSAADLKRRQEEQKKEAEEPEENTDEEALQEDVKEVQRFSQKAKSYQAPSISRYRTISDEENIIRPGDKNEYTIMGVQDSLIEKGYLAEGQDDGAFGPTTARAIFNATGYNVGPKGINASSLENIIDSAEQNQGTPLGSAKKKRSGRGRGKSDPVDLSPTQQGGLTFF